MISSLPILVAPPMPYFAGLMDTHGAFCNPSDGTPSYKFRNTKKDMLDILANQFGGNVNKVKVKNKAGATFEWQISHNRLHDTLLSLRPWFFLRKQAVEDILARIPNPVGRPKLYVVEDKS